MVDSVKLTPLDPPGSTNWKVAHGWGSSSNPNNYPHVKLGQNSGAQIITFDIKDSNSVTFDPNDPVWVQVGSKPGSKPTAPNDMGQIGGFKVLNNGKQLVIVDWNTDKTDLYYHMNFVGHGPLDPIIENGGGIKPSYTNYLAEYGTLILVALVSLVVGGFLHRVLFGRRGASG